MRNAFYNASSILGRLRSSSRRQNFARRRVPLANAEDLRSSDDSPISGSAYAPRGLTRANIRPTPGWRSLLPAKNEERVRGTPRENLPFAFPLPPVPAPKPRARRQSSPLVADAERRGARERASEREEALNFILRAPRVCFA